jgi:oleandomycin transport system permease protein
VAHDILITVAWSALLTAVMMPIAVRKYSTKA